MNLASVIIGVVASVVVTSAMVAAQAPRAEPSGTTVTVMKDVQKKEVMKGKGARKAVVKARSKADAKREEAAPILLPVARPANFDNVIQQYMRQARPLVRSELVFVRRICGLDVEHLRRINQDAEAALEDVARKFVEAQQQRRIRVRVQGVVQTSPAFDGPSLLHERVAAVMKRDLTAEQFCRYQAEVEKRDADRKLAAVNFLVNAIDGELYLSDHQRRGLAEALASRWDESWGTSLEYLLYGNKFYPAGIDPCVTPLLDANQRKVWQGTQKIMGIGGPFGMMGGIANDRDALEDELGEVRKAEVRKARPRNAAPVPAPGVAIEEVQIRSVPMKRVELKKAATREPATKP